MAGHGLGAKVFITACAATGATNLAARFLGAPLFLPQLFVERYSKMGSLDTDVFTAQLKGARSFRDDRWSSYWRRIAAEHEANAGRQLRRLGAPDPFAVGGVLRAEDRAALTSALAPAATAFADHGPQPSSTDILQVTGSLDPEAPAVIAFGAIDAWIKAITYCQVAAFPGHSRHRMQAYWRSRTSSTSSSMSSHRRSTFTWNASRSPSVATRWCAACWYSQRARARIRPC